MRLSVLRIKGFPFGVAARRLATISARSSDGDRFARARASRLFAAQNGAYGRKIFWYKVFDLIKSHFKANGRK